MKPLRSFQQRQEQRKISNVVIILCMFLCLYLLSIFKSHYCPESKLDVHLASRVNPKMATASASQDSLQHGEDDEDDDDDDDDSRSSLQPICDFSGSRSDTCDVEGDVRVHVASTTIFFRTSSPLHNQHRQWRIHPYARKNTPAQNYVKEWILQPSSPAVRVPHCTTNHSDPVVVFSGGGFTGNMFHDFTDVLVPLFISSHQFHRKVHFIVADGKPWWVDRYSSILKKLSCHHLINVDSVAKDVVHCFPRAVVGPAFHRELGVDSDLTPEGYTIAEFRTVLRKALGLKRENVTTMTTTFRPRLLIIERKKSRVLMNQRAIEEMAKSIGFDVVVGEPNPDGDFTKFARLVNSADVLLGVHGSGLTNMIFLPTGAVMVIVVPFGSLHWLARGNFGDPGTAMGLKYLEYQAQAEESSLSDEYPADSEVLRNPLALHKKGWGPMQAVYLDKQNVRPHLARLKETLLQAIKLLPEKNP